MRTNLKTLFALLIPLGLLLGFQACSKTDSSSGVSEAKLADNDNADMDGGHEHGNGGDDLRYAKSAWFAQNTRAVQYCVQITADFPLAKEQVLAGINSALADWLAQLAKRPLYSTTLISQKFNLVDDCNQADLRFSMGGVEPLGSQSKIAWALRETFDTKTAWGHGMIWISKSGAIWTDAFRFKGALLHMLGEVLGFANVAGTILDNNWERWVVAPRTADIEAKLSNIEGDRQLSDSLGLLKGSVAMTEPLKHVLGLTTSLSSEIVTVDFSSLTIAVQSQSYRFVILHSQAFLRGDLHRVVAFDPHPLYSFMKTIPMFRSAADKHTVDIIQFLDLPNRPQMVLEINGDQALALTPMD